ncbi:hypothetical protein [Lactiplantibacillus plantarum]|uniref:hypothetical protein n=1 Tax=Lactiplantibacillus plantarum TaxID=1590 RepID=UPI0032191B46
MKKEELVIKEVRHWLLISGLDCVSVQRLLSKYRVPLDKWVREYLVTGSHLTPEDFADEIQQAEEMRQLVSE